MRVRLISFIVFMFIIVSSCMPATAASEKVPPSEKIIVKNGSWEVDSYVNPSGQYKLYSMYTGSNVQAEDTDMEDLEFSVSSAVLLSRIYIECIYTNNSRTLTDEQFSVILKDSNGELVGQWPAIIENSTELSLNQEEPKNLTATVLIQDGTVLEKGSYSLTVTNPEEIIYSKSTKYAPALLIVGVNNSHWEAYEEGLSAAVINNQSHDNESISYQAYDFTGTYNINVITDGSGDGDTFGLAIIDHGETMELTGRYIYNTHSTSSNEISGQGIIDVPFNITCPVIEREGTTASITFELGVNLSGLPYMAKVGADLVIDLDASNIGYAPSLKAAGTAYYSMDNKNGDDSEEFSVAVAGERMNSLLPDYALLQMAKIGRAGNVPGPQTTEQAAAGIILPPLTAIVFQIVLTLKKPRFIPPQFDNGAGVFDKVSEMGAGGDVTGAAGTKTELSAPVEVKAVASGNVNEYRPRFDGRTGKPINYDKVNSNMGDVAGNPVNVDGNRDGTELSRSMDLAESRSGSGNNPINSKGVIKDVPKKASEIADIIEEGPKSAEFGKLGARGISAKPALTESPMNMTSSGIDNLVQGKPSMGIEGAEMVKLSSVGNPEIKVTVAEKLLSMTEGSSEGSGLNSAIKDMSSHVVGEVTGEGVSTAMGKVTDHTVKSVAGKYDNMIYETSGAVEEALPDDLNKGIMLTGVQPETKDDESEDV